MKFLTTTATNTILAILSSSLFITPSIALPAPDLFPEADANANTPPFGAIPPELVARDDHLDPRQAASARITNVTSFRGEGCPSAASFRFTINPQLNSIAITFTNFIVVVPAPSSTTTARCDLGIQMTFPAVCLSIPSTTAQYRLFGRFGEGVGAGMDSTYSITSPGRIVSDNNPPRRFSGPQFADGEEVSLTERVGIQFNTTRLITNAVFGLGILDAITAGGGAASGGRFQVRNVTWSLGSQVQC